MVYVYAFWAAVALALAGIWVDVVAYRRGVAKGLVVAAGVLKATVAAAFAVYFIALRLGLFTGWADLAAFATLIVATPFLLGAAMICDGLALRAVRALRASDDAA